MCKKEQQDLQMHHEVAVCAKVSQSMGLQVCTRWSCKVLEPWRSGENGGNSSLKLGVFLSGSASTCLCVALAGGWWFSTCGHANLNGRYFRSIPRQRHERKQGIFWKTWKGRYYPLKSTTMKIQHAALEAEP